MSDIEGHGIRGSADVSLSEAVFSALVYSLATTLWISFVLAEIGQFALWRVLVAESIVLLVSGRRLWGGARVLTAGSRLLMDFREIRDLIRWRPRRAALVLDDGEDAERTGVIRHGLDKAFALISTLDPERRAWPFLVALVVLAAALFFHPAEFYFGGYDAGGYVMAGAHIAKSGGIVIDDPAMRQLSSEHPGLASSGALVRYPGFWLSTTVWQGVWPSLQPTPGVVVPHGYHLYPTLLALGFAVGGLPGLQIATPLVSLVAVLGLFMLGRRLFGARVGAVASLFLVLNISEVWFARYPAAENLAQAMLFAGLTSLALMLRTRRVRYAALAGLCLGLVQIAKIEVLALPLVAFGCFVVILASRKLADKCWLTFFGIYAALVAHMALHAVAIALGYASFHYGLIAQALFGTRLRVAMIGLLAVVGTLAVVVWTRRLRPRLSPDTLVRLERWVRTAAGIVVAVLTLYGLYIRPFAAPWPGPASQLTAEQGQLFVMNEAMARLGWYITEPTILLAMVGACLILWRGAGRAQVVLVALLVVDAVVFLGDSRVNPVHFWAARRWLITIIPLMLLLAAYSLDVIARATKTDHAVRILPVLVMVALVASYSTVTLKFFDYSEYQGATSQLSTLAAAIPANAAVVFDDDVVGQRFAAPLNYVWDRDTYVAGISADQRSIQRQIIAEWLGEGRQVYWVRYTNAPVSAGDTFPKAAPLEQTIDLPEILATLDHLPGRFGEFRVTVQIAKLTGLPTQ